MEGSGEECSAELRGVAESTAIGPWTYVFCINLSGRMTPEEKMAPADLAVP